MKKVIYFGLPMWLCGMPNCNLLDGFWSWIAEWLPFNGWFFVYEGSYWRALYHWLIEAEDE